MTVAERVAELHSLLGRLINSRGPRVEYLSLRISARTKERLVTMAEAWGSTRSGVAAEILEAAMSEAWAAFERAKEGAK